MGIYQPDPEGYGFGPEARQKALDPSRDYDPDVQRGGSTSLEPDEDLVTGGSVSPDLTMHEEGAKILAMWREKYPRYKSLDDQDLADAIAEKFPRYAPMLLPYRTVNQDFLVDTKGLAREAEPAEGGAGLLGATADVVGPKVGEQYRQRVPRPLRRELETGAEFAKTGLQEAERFAEPAFKPVRGALEKAAETFSAAGKNAGPFGVVAQAPAALTGAAAGMTTPENFALGVGAEAVPLGKLGGAAMSGGFAYMAGKQAMQRKPKIIDYIQKGDYQSAIREAGAAGLDAVVAFLAGVHALGGGIAGVQDFMRGAKDAGAIDTKPVQEPAVAEQGRVGELKATADDLANRLSREFADRRALKLSDEDFGPAEPPPGGGGGSPAQTRAAIRRDRAAAAAREGPGQEAWDLAHPGEPAAPPEPEGLESLTLDQHPLDTIYMPGEEPGPAVEPKSDYPPLERTQPLGPPADPNSVALLKQTEAQKGFIDTSDVPPEMAREIWAEDRAAAIAAQLADESILSGKRAPIKDSEGYIVGWTGGKSPIPVPLQGRLLHSEIVDAVEKGLKGEEQVKTGRHSAYLKKKFYQDLIAHLVRQYDTQTGRNFDIDDDMINDYATRHGFTVTTKDVYDEMNKAPEPREAGELEGAEPEGEADLSFDPVELEAQRHADNAEAGHATADALEEIGAKEAAQAARSHATASEQARDELQSEQARGHRSYYDQGGKPIPVEEIPANTPTVSESKKLSPKRKAVQLAAAQADLQKMIARYNDLRARGDAAVSDYDKSMGYDLNFNLALAYNQVAWAKGMVKALGGKVPEAVEGIVRNDPPPASQQDEVAFELGVRGVNPEDPQAVGDHIAKMNKLSKPVKVTTGQEAVSKAVEHPDHYEAATRRGTPAEVTHEVDQHITRADEAAQLKKQLTAERDEALRVLERIEKKQAGGGKLTKAESEAAMRGYAWRGTDIDQQAQSIMASRRRAEEIKASPEGQAQAANEALNRGMDAEAKRLIKNLVSADDPGALVDASPRNVAARAAFLLRNSGKGARGSPLLGLLEERANAPDELREPPSPYERGVDRVLSREEPDLEPEHEADQHHEGVGVEEQLAEMYRRIVSGDTHGMDLRGLLDNMRATLEEAQKGGMTPSGLKESLSDQEILAAAKDAYQRRLELRGRIRPGATGGVEGAKARLDELAARRREGRTKPAGPPPAAPPPEAPPGGAGSPPAPPAPPGGPTGGDGTPEGPGANKTILDNFLDRLRGGPEGHFWNRSQDTKKFVGDVANTIVTTAYQNQIVAEQHQRIGEKGTIGEEGTLEGGAAARETREKFRDMPVKPNTYQMLFSQEQIAHVNKMIDEAMALSKKFAADVARFGDETSVNASRTMNKILDELTRQMVTLRYAAGRSVKQFDRPGVVMAKGEMYALSPEVIENLQALGRVADELRDAKIRRPIYTNIYESLKHWGKLDPGQKMVLWRNIVDAFRLNLFSVTSFTLDMITNAGEIGSQLAEAGGRDLYALSKGQVFPHLRGFMQALRWSDWNKNLMQQLAPHTAGGELINSPFQRLPGLEGVPLSEEEMFLNQARKWGVFTERSNLPSKIVDTAVGGPLYLKQAFDQGAAHFASQAALFAEANKAMPEGLTPVERQLWRREFVKNPTEDAMARAMEQGKKAKFDRPLTQIEERIGRSVTYRLLGDVFARWPFQFTRWFGEMVGVDPAAWRKIYNGGNINVDAAAGYLAKAATGLGGLYMLNQTLYPNVDFHSMEYVDKDNNRYRLTGREPLPTAFTALALFNAIAKQDPADWEKFKAGLQFSSVPFGKLSNFTGGLLSSIVSASTVAAANKKIDPSAMERNIADWANQAIPGQALLNTLKTFLDPTVREGFGARLPGISLTKPAVPDPTTGRELQPMQSVLGVGPFRTVGAPIPGAKRELTPVYRLLMRFGTPVYRGPQTAIVGIPPGALEDLEEAFRDKIGIEKLPQRTDLMREFQQQLGLARETLLQPVAERIKLVGDGKWKIGDDSDTLDYEMVRRLVQKLDAAAAKNASRVLMMKYHILPKAQRQPTLRELQGPESWLKDLREVELERQGEINKARE